MKHYEDWFSGDGSTSIYYQGWDPDGPVIGALAIMHGLGEHGGRYMNLVNHLVPAGFAVTAMDLRGHGRSEGQRGHIESWNQIVVDLEIFQKMTQARYSGRKLFLMGHSLGGLIVLDYAIVHQQGLCGVIASAPSLSQTAISPFLMTLARTVSRMLPSLPMKSGLNANGISRDPQVVIAYKEDPLVHDSGTPRFATEGEAAMSRVNERAEDLRLPTLMLHGEVDSLVPIASTEQFFTRVNYPDKQLIKYPGGYHESHNDLHYQIVVDDMKNWLLEHLK